MSSAGAVEQDLVKVEQGPDEDASGPEAQLRQVSAALVPLSSALPPQRVTAEMAGSMMLPSAASTALSDPNTKSVHVQQTINNYNAPVMAQSNTKTTDNSVKTDNSTKINKTSTKSVSEGGVGVGGRPTDKSLVNITEGTYLGKCTRCNQEIHRNYDDERGEGASQGYYTCSTFCGGICIHSECADAMALASQTGSEIVLRCPYEETCVQHLEGGPIVIKPRRMLLKSFVDWFLTWPWYYGWRIFVLCLLLGYVAKFFIMGSIYGGWQEPNLCFNPQLANVSKITLWKLLDYRFVHVALFDMWAYRVKYEFDQNTGDPVSCMVAAEKRMTGKYEAKKWRKTPEDEEEDYEGEGSPFWKVWGAKWWDMEMSDGVQISYGMRPDKHHFWMGMWRLVFPFYPGYFIWTRVVPWFIGKFKKTGMRASIRVARPKGQLPTGPAQKVGGVRRK